MNNEKILDNIIEYLYSIDCHADYKIEEIAQDLLSMMEREYEKGFQDGMKASAKVVGRSDWVKNE